MLRSAVDQGRYRERVLHVRSNLPRPAEFVSKLVSNWHTSAVRIADDRETSATTVEHVSYA